MFTPNGEPPIDMPSAAAELKNRGGHIISVGATLDGVLHDFISDTNVGATTPIVEALPSQLLGYYAALARGPRTWKCPGQALLPGHWRGREMSEQSALTPIVDTHAHLDNVVFDGDRPEVIANARQVGITHIINIGYRPESWNSSKALRETFVGMSFALGLHPQLADQFDDNLEHDLHRAIGEFGPVAIGETGFDLFRKGPSFRDQERAFRAQIAMAVETQLPLIIHQRDAGNELMAELDRWPSLASIVLHSFDGNNRLTEWAIERGCHIGVGGLATKAGSQALRALLAKFPLRRILLETDSPYLAPPRSISRRNTPAQLPAIAAMLAPIWDLTAEELCCQTTRNAGQLFDIGFV